MKQLEPLEVKEDEPLLFSHGNCQRNVIWDFSTTGSLGMGLVHSAVKPPFLVGNRERKFDGNFNQTVQMCHNKHL